MKRLAIVTTHPVQYYAPVFRLLQERARILPTVFYTTGSHNETYDPGFNRHIKWDIPLLDGYRYELVENIAKDPGSHHFKGAINPGLIAAIDASEPDAVLVIGWSYASHLKVMRHYHHVRPVYFRGDSTLLDACSSLRQLLRPVMLRWIYRHVDHAFYNGTHNRAYFKKYGLKDRQLSFAPHAIDNERFGADHSAEAEQLRRDLGIAADEILVLFSGKFESKKAPLFLLENFLKIDLEKVHLAFTGSGTLEPALRKMAMGKQNIHFLPFQNQSVMPVVYQSCDLYCLPSSGPAETWGLAVNEAMASGKAVLVSDKVGCGADLVLPDNGAIFQSGNSEAFCSALARLTVSRKNLAALGTHSKNIIQPWNFENIAIAIENQLLHEKN